MDILACPICKNFPLDLHVFEEKEEIVEGLLVCRSCNRWYPIIDEIPHLLPDQLREAADDGTFMRKWSGRFPETILKGGKPFNEKNL